VKIEETACFTDDIWGKGNKGDWRRGNLKTRRERGGGPKKSGGEKIKLGRTPSTRKVGKTIRVQKGTIATGGQRKGKRGSAKGGGGFPLSEIREQVLG